MANNRASDKSRAGGRMGHWVISKKSSFIEPNIHYVNFDKVTLTIQKAYTILFSNEDELSRFSISLKQAQKDCLFSRSHKNQFTFSKNFLFSGKLFLIRDFHEQKRYGALPIKIKLQLYLNPTRAVRHASYTSNLKHFNYKNYLNSLAPLTVLEKEPLVNHSSLGLDGEDNVIDKVDVFFNERPAKNVFNLYLNKVLEIIDTALVETASQMSFECNLQEAMEDWTVDHAECY